MSRLGTWFIGGLAFAASCSEEPLVPTTGDRVPEVSFSGAELVREFAPDSGYLLSPLLEISDRATTVGLMFDVKRDRIDGSATFEARGFDRFGHSGQWVPAELTWSELELRVARADLGVAAVEAQIRVSEKEAEELSFVLWSAVVPIPSDDAPIATLDRGGIRTDRHALSASLSAAGVKSRADWGARGTLCTDLDPVKTRMAIHHTVSPVSSSNGYEARLRQIQAFHMDTRGWCDVGYHFFVTADGSRWEAREAIYLGAHVANNNSNNVGTVLVGCFQPGDPTCDQAEFQPNVPPEVMIQGTGTMIGLLKNEYGIPVNDQTVLGHRDHAGASTSCPGDAVYSQLGRIRDLANGVSPGPETGTIKGVVWDLSVTQGPSDPGNVHITNAQVTASSGQTVQVRATDAFWTFTLEPGMYTFTAEAPGFSSASRSLMITANQEIWGSIGLVPIPPVIELTVHVTDEDGASIEGAEVSLGTIGAGITGADGSAAFTAPAAGSALLTVTKEGFSAYQSEVSFTQSVTFEIQLSLLRSSGNALAEPGETIDESPSVLAAEPRPQQQPQQPQDPPADANQGCGCNTHSQPVGVGAGLGGAWLVLLLLIRFVRRNKPCP